MKAEAAFANLLATLKREIAEDLGMKPVEGERPKCPVCGYGIEVKWMRHSKAFLAIHMRTPESCPYRYETFAKGATEKETWAAIERIHNAYV